MKEVAVATKVKNHSSCYLRNLWEFIISYSNVSEYGMHILKSLDMVLI